MKLRLLGRRLLIRRLSQVEQTKGGLILPSEARELPQLGEIAFIGNFPHGLNVGDKVIFPKFWDQKITLNNEQLLMMTDKDLIAKLEN